MQRRPRTKAMKKKYILNKSEKRRKRLAIPSYGLAAVKK
jgi:hypothetical protein